MSLKVSLRAATVVALLVSAFQATADDKSGHAFHAAMLAGSYDVVGSAPESRAAYSGSVEVTVSGGKFEITKTVAGKTTEGSGEIDHTKDNRHVLRVRWNDGLEGTYQWWTDLDNHARVSGFVARNSRATVPGLESWFAKK